MIIDIILIFFAITGFWLGYAKGLLGTLLNATLYFIALILTLLISPWLAKFISSTLPVGKLFALIFGTIALFILISFLLYTLTKRWDVKLTQRNRSKPSKVFGGIVMLLLSILIYGLLVGTMDQFQLIRKERTQDSYTYPFLKPIPLYAGKLVETFRPVFRQYWDMMEETIQQSQSEKE